MNKELLEKVKVSELKNNDYFVLPSNLNLVFGVLNTLYRSRMYVVNNSRFGRLIKTERFITSIRFDTSMKVRVFSENTFVYRFKSAIDAIHYIENTKTLNNYK